MQIFGVRIIAKKMLEMSFSTFANHRRRHSLKMDESDEMLLSGILSCLSVFWLTLIGCLIGCSKKKKGPVKTVGQSAASVAAPAPPKPQSAPSNAAAAKSTPNSKAPGAAAPADGKDENKMVRIGGKTLFVHIF